MDECKNSNLGHHVQVLSHITLDSSSVDWWETEPPTTEQFFGLYGIIIGWLYIIAVAIPELPKNNIETFCELFATYAPKM